MQGSLGEGKRSFNNAFSINYCQFRVKQFYFFLAFEKL